MTSENDFIVKPLTNPQYVTPTNQSGEHPGHNKRKPPNPKPKEPEQTIGDDLGDDGDDTLHVIDYRA
jgi:hypothetical protein